VFSRWILHCNDGHQLAERVAERIQQRTIIDRPGVVLSVSAIGRRGGMVANGGMWTQTSIRACQTVT
jgi:hypothetical protein